MAVSITVLMHQALVWCGVLLAACTSGGEANTATSSTVIDFGDLGTRVTSVRACMGLAETDPASWRTVEVTRGQDGRWTSSLDGHEPGTYSLVVSAREDRAQALGLTTTGGHSRGPPAQDVTGGSV